LKMIYSILAFAAVAVAQPTLEGAFSAFMTKHNKSYEDAEEHAYRMSVFADNLERSSELNRQNMLINGEAVFGVTQFSDLTSAEFQAQYLNYRPRPRGEVEVPTFDGPIANDVDWRNNGVVTPIKDQGQCGSCWAFGATAAIESYGKLVGGYALQTLAPQQITSCDTTSYGCQGGWAEHAFNYVVKAGGIQAEATYPYTSGTTGQTGSCRANPSSFVAKIRGYTAVAAGESNLATALNSGPPTVCLAATYFQTYTGGILSVCDNNVDHCVQAIGYTSTYWIVRNSWGTGWGEAGYIRVQRGSDLCMISDDVTYPTF